MSELFSYGVGAIYFGMMVRRSALNFKGLAEYFKKEAYGIIGGLVMMLVFGMILLYVKMHLNYLLIIFIILLDILYGKLRKKNLAYRLVLHYMAPFYFLVGLFKDADRRKAYSVTEVS